MKLRLEKNEITGTLKDKSGVVRGLWFRDMQHARDPQQLTASAAILAAMGEKFDENDRTILSLRNIGGLPPPIEPLAGGYCVKFLSASRPWWKKLFGVKTASMRPSATSETQVAPSIHRAAMAGDLAKAKELLKRDPRLVFSKEDDTGRTPLHYAVPFGHKEMVKLLLVNKADVNAQNSSGETPLALALEQGHQDIAELLRQHGGHE
jgi:ankyrin repeat protein